MANTHSKISEYLEANEGESFIAVPREVLEEAIKQPTVTESVQDDTVNNLKKALAQERASKKGIEEKLTKSVEYLDRVTTEMKKRDAVVEMDKRVTASIEANPSLKGKEAIVSALLKQNEDPSKDSDYLKEIGLLGDKGTNDGKDTKEVGKQGEKKETLEKSTVVLDENADTSGLVMPSKEEMADPAFWHKMTAKQIGSLIRKSPEVAKAYDDYVVKIEREGTVVQDVPVEMITD